MADRGFDLRLQFILLTEELAHVRNRTAVVRDALRIVALVDRGFAFQEDGSANDGVDVGDFKLTGVETVVGFFLIFRDFAQLMHMQGSRVEFFRFQHDGFFAGREVPICVVIRKRACKAAEQRRCQQQHCRQQE